MHRGDVQTVRIKCIFCAHCSHIVCVWFAVMHVSPESAQLRISCTIGAATAAALRYTELRGSQRAYRTGFLPNPPPPLLGWRGRGLDASLRAYVSACVGCDPGPGPGKGGGTSRLGLRGTGLDGVELGGMELDGIG